MSLLLPTEHLISNTTTIEPFQTASLAAGYVAVTVAVLLFGSNYVPVKKFYSGNGMFFQWILCSGIWITGLICTAVRGFPQYRPLPMIGGALWCTANLTTVPIINSIGLAKGILVWGSFNLLSGWASSRFGWFGVNAQVPGNIIMNYAGVVLCLVSASVYLFMKTTGNVEVEVPKENKEIASNHKHVDTFHDNQTKSITITANDEKNLNEVSKKDLHRKIWGTVMSVVAGVMYGLTFIPVIYLKDNFPGYSQNGLDYVFSHYCGIFSASTLYFIAYSIISRNNPVIYSNIIFPGFVSGLMCGTASIGWFVANNILSESISFPIVSTIPGIVGSLWGLYFKEIVGWKNYLVLVVAISFGIVGSALTGLSK